MNIKKIFTEMILIALLFLVIPSFAIAGDFTDNGDGTITDNKTGLMWMQATSENKMTWNKALSYCENLELAGFNDWRLPNIKELRSIVDYSDYHPAVDTDFFPETVSSYYWSSTTNSSNTDGAWLVYFYHGFDDYYNKSETYYVRAVRGGQ